MNENRKVLHFIQATPARRSGVRSGRRGKNGLSRRWFDTAVDPLPSGIDPLLIRVSGVYYHATFDVSKSLFRAVDELRQTIFRLPEYRVFWKPAVEGI